MPTMHSPAADTHDPDSPASKWRMPALGTAVDEMFARTTADPSAGTVDLLALLAALVAERETRADRLFANFCGRPLGPADYRCVYRD